MMKWSSRRRAALGTLLALGGAAVLIVEITTLDAAPFHIPLIALSTLMVYIGTWGTWRLTGQLFHPRANRVLRGEIERFTSLVRQLYGHRTNADAAAFYETKAALRESLHRIISAASTYQEEGPPAER